MLRQTRRAQVEGQIAFFSVLETFSKIFAFGKFWKNGCPSMSVSEPGVAGQCFFALGRRANRFLLEKISVLKKNSP